MQAHNANRPSAMIIDVLTILLIVQLVIKIARQSLVIKCDGYNDACTSLDWPEACFLPEPDRSSVRSFVVTKFVSKLI